MTFQSDLAFDGAGNLFLTGLAPPNGREAAILTTLPPGNFTAIDQSVRTASDGGVNQTRELGSMTSRCRLLGSAFNPNRSWVKVE